MVSLEQILNLVGTLDDSPAENTARQRFRSYLGSSIGAVGSVRDYIEVCLKTTGPQYDRALQDLVNHTGALIGFQVEFGRYAGVQGEIGFDGLWKSGDFTIVVEVKKTDVYAIASKTLLGYINNLISEKKIASSDHALGLYIVGHSDVSLQHLKNMIVGEKRSHELRLASVDSMLSIAELIQNKEISHEEAVRLIKPGGVVVDDVVELISRVASQASAEAASPPPAPAPPAEAPSVTGAPVTPVQLDAVSLYVITPIRDEPTRPAKDALRDLLGHGWYVVGERTPSRKKLKPGDYMCFYQTGAGVVAAAELDSAPELKQIPYVKNPEQYPWAFKVKNPRYFFDKPVVIDAALRSQLDAFHGRKPDDAWSWFVQATRTVTEHDFHLLTGSAPTS